VKDLAISYQCEIHQSHIAILNPFTSLEEISIPLFLALAVLELSDASKLLGKKTIL
jgi:hypothetical protein